MEKVQRRPRYPLTNIDARSIQFGRIPVIRSRSRVLYPDEEKKPRVHLPGVISDEGPVSITEGIFTIRARIACYVPGLRKGNAFHEDNMTGQDLQEEQRSRIFRVGVRYLFRGSCILNYKSPVEVMKVARSNGR